MESKRSGSVPVPLLLVLVLAVEERCWRLKLKSSMPTYQAMVPAASSENVTLSAPMSSAEPVGSRYVHFSLVICQAIHVTLKPVLRK